MNIRLLSIQDTPELEGFLFKHHAQCMFMGNNLKRSGIVYQAAPFQGEYWGHFNARTEQIDGVIVHYWNGNVMMFAPDIQILNALATHLRDHTQRPISGVLGPGIQAEIVIKVLGIPPTSYQVNRTEGLYQLDLDNVNALPLLPPFEIREAQKISKSLLTQWMQDYEMEALGAPKDAQLHERVLSKIENLVQGDCWILLKDNIPVSLSAFNARFKDAVQVGPVWTPPHIATKGLQECCGPTL